jgi:hypothetical protein
MSDWLEVIEIDMINLAGMAYYIYLPPTMYESVTWALGALVALSLISLNVAKTITYLKGKKHDHH